MSVHAKSSASSLARCQTNLTYVAGTSTHGIRITPSFPFSLHTFTDTDWSSDPNDRKSITATAYFLVLTLSCRLQRNKRRCHKVAPKPNFTEIFWILSLLVSFAFHPQKPVIHSSNLGAILLTAKPIMHSRTKHFELDLHYVREKVQKNELMVRHIPRRLQIADVLTRVFNLRQPP